MALSQRAEEGRTVQTETRKAMPPLNPTEEAIIAHKCTEPPYSGRYVNHKAEGTYVCRACGAPLYASGDKFASDCGWPSFDDALPDAVKQQPDADGRRVEIVCSNCGGHLGHVFNGEGFTLKNIRHCVNSLSLSFIPKGDPLPLISSVRAVAGSAATGSRQSLPTRKRASAVFAGGCFWGVEHVFSKTPGVVDAESGYSGGTVPDPTYEQVCAGRTGHAEAVKVTYDPSVVSYEQLARLFFELHDPTQVNRQGPDVGTQYRSVLFYDNEQEKGVAEKLVSLLLAKGYTVATELAPAATFYPAEPYHQKYIAKNPGRHCHLPVKRFD